MSSRDFQKAIKGNMKFKSIEEITSFLSNIDNFLSTRRKGEVFKSRIIFDREMNLEILVSECYGNDFEVNLFHYVITNNKWELNWICDVSNHKIEEYCWYYLDRMNNTNEHDGQKYCVENLNLKESE